MNNKQFQMKKVILALAAVLGTVPALASATEVEWGGDIVVRPFHRDNARDFQENVSDTKNFTTERARLKANIKLDEDISGVVEIMNLKLWGSSDPNRTIGTTTSSGTCTAPAAGGAVQCSDINWLGVNQAYIQVKNVFDSGWYLKIGSQEMAYGDQRLIGNTNFWSTFPFPRSYDAIKVGAQYDAFDVDAWTAKVSERQLGTLFGATSTAANAATYTPSDRDFRGVWATLKKIIPDNTLDLYLLSMTDAGYNSGGGLSTLTSTGTTFVTPNFGMFPYQLNGGAAIGGGTNVYNWGTRLKGKYANLDYTVELNHQTGHFADGQSISANGDAVRVGYTIPEAMGLRINGEFVYASGDSSPTTGDHTTFYQFTPSPHGMLGAQDFIAFQNIRATKIGASFNAKSNLKLSADFWNFKLAQANDGWYSSNGTSTRGSLAPWLATGAEGKLADRNIGTEFDLIANYTYSKPLTLELGYSAFNPGSGIKGAANSGTTGLLGHNLGAADRATFAWGMLTLKF